MTRTRTQWRVLEVLPLVSLAMFLVVALATRQWFAAAVAVWGYVMVLILNHRVRVYWARGVRTGIVTALEAMDAADTMPEAIRLMAAARPMPWDSPDLTGQLERCEICGEQSWHLDHCDNGTCPLNESG